VKRWLLLAIVVVLGAAVGVGAALYVTRKDTPGGTPSIGSSANASAGATTAPVAQDPGGLPVSKVVSAGPGSGKGADGVTPIGFPRTREGAVTAATNYVLFIRGSKRLAGPGGPETFKQLLAPTNSLLAPDLVTAYTQLHATYDKAEAHPEWAAFRVIADQTPQSVSVQIALWTAVQYKTGERAVEWSTVNVVVTWSGTDWQVGNTRPEDFPDTDLDRLKGREKPLSAPEKAELFGPGWEEYANAAR
jgi:hypothetical protein